MTRVAIIGSREHKDLDAVRKYVRSLPEGTIVVTGGARGVDQAAMDEAKKCGMNIAVYYPRWDLFGRSAGIMRNRLIVDESDRVVAFWDGVSKGTKFGIDYAAKKGKEVLVFP